MEKTSVWILFSVANNYDQPERAFEQLWWQKPTAGELAKYTGVGPDGFEMTELLNGERVRSGGTYWLDEIAK